MDKMFDVLKDALKFSEGNKMLRFMLAAILLLIILYALTAWWVAFISNKPSVAVTSSSTPNTLDSLKDNRNDTLQRNVGQKESVKPSGEENRRTKSGHNTQTQKLSELTGSEKTVVKGNNAHVISGNNNQVGVNGDVNINMEKELSQTDLSQLIDAIEAEKRENNSDTNWIVIGTTQLSNGQKAVSQIIAFLTAKGYTARNTMMSLSNGEPLKGINVKFGLNRIWVTVGIL